MVRLGRSYYLHHKTKCVRKSIGDSHFSNIKDNKYDINNNVINKNDNNNETDNSKRVDSLD